MRSWLLLLLVGLLPGLLVPPGLVVRACRCTPAAATSAEAAAKGSCCRAEPEPAPGCPVCSRHAALPSAPLPKPAAEPGQPTAAPHGCDCTIEVPARDDDGTPPPPPIAKLDLPPLQLAWQPASALPEPGASQPLRFTLRGPPPPELGRNLPLRI